MKIDQRILIVIVIGMLGYNLFLNNSIQTDIQLYENKISNIQTKIDSVTKLNKKLDNKIETLHTKLELIDTDIVNVQKNIHIIKANTNEKVNSVDSYSFTELERFFATRYYTGLDSIN